MLLGINPLLRGELLSVLDSMGHGDVLVIADANFPARRIGRRIHDLAAVNSTEALEAIATLFPIDAEEPVTVMAAAGLLPIHHEFAQALAGRTHGEVEAAGRHEFYELSSQAELVVITGELRPYGNIILRKGVVARGQD